MSSQGRVAVIGLGGSGSAAAFRLTKAGFQVTGYEQFQIGHSRGSSHGATRIIRYTYPDLLYTQMMADAYPLWHEAEQLSGKTLMVKCGGLYLGPQDHLHLVETSNALQATNTPYETLLSDEVSKRFPGFRLQPGEIGLYQRESGYLRPEQCVRAHIELATAAGVDAREDCRVLAIDEAPSGVEVRDDQGVETYDHVVVTAGAWLTELLSSLRLPTKVTRQQVTYFDVERPCQSLEPGAFPVWIDAGANAYGFPADGEHPGIKIASHDHGIEVDPNEEQPRVSADYIDQMAEYARNRFVGLDGQCTFSHTCLYTNLPDEHFVLDWVPGSDRILVVSGCSGHGFKFTALLGEIAARLISGTGYHLPLDRFRIDRFG